VRELFSIDMRGLVSAPRVDIELDAQSRFLDMCVRFDSPW
jgi:hypothetical protein